MRTLQLNQQVSHDPSDRHAADNLPDNPPPSSTESYSADHTSNTFAVEYKGTPVAQTSIVEVKTRSDRKERHDIMSAQLPRLWIRQITQSALTFHDHGRFEIPKSISVSNELQEWQTNNKKNIARYAAILSMIKQAVVKHGKIEVRCDGPSSLEIHTLNRDERDEWNVASQEMIKEWAGE